LIRRLEVGQIAGPLDLDLLRFYCDYLMQVYWY